MIFKKRMGRPPFIKNMGIHLVPVSSNDDVEWLRVERNRPEIHRHFRQSKPISVEEQKLWWRSLDKSRVRLFLVKIKDENVGYAGFNPFSLSARRAELGIFIIYRWQKQGIGREALLQLLEKGFKEYNLSTIVGEVLDWPRETRFAFYNRIGFNAFPKEQQHLQYQKGDKWIPSIRFYMTREMWEKMHDKSDSGRLAAC